MIAKSEVPDECKLNFFKKIDLNNSMIVNITGETDAKYSLIWVS